MKTYDISQTIREGIPVWPGDQRFRLRRTMAFRNGDPCNVSAVTMSTHTGTHIDAPYHFDDSGADVAGVSLHHYVGPARVVAMPVQGAVSFQHLEALDWRGVERVLFQTRADDVAEDRFDRNFVFLSEEAAHFLGRLGLLLVGTDAPSVDPFKSRSFPTPKILLSYGVAILEGARLERVPPGDYELICLPLKLAGLDGSPVRAVLRS